MPSESSAPVEKHPVWRSGARGGRLHQQHVGSGWKQLLSGSKVGTDLLSAGLQQVPQMLHQLGKRGSVGGTVQPAVQHDLISTEEGRISVATVRARARARVPSLTSQWGRILEASSSFPP